MTIMTTEQQETGRDYRRISQAIEFIRQHADNQPTLEQIAARLHLSVFHFQRMFCRWAGVTPKRYLQIITVARAKALLSNHAGLLETAHSLGMSGGSRLYDHFVNLEAVTPGEYKAAGTGLDIEYDIQDSPFGDLFIAMTARGICRLGFMDIDGGQQTPRAHLARLQRDWPRARLRRNPQAAGAMVARLFAEQMRLNRPLSLLVRGTNFQVNVWRALLRIPPGTLCSYGQVAEAVGRPDASRAVGSAVGANPVAFIIPCHRVVRRDGGLGGYHWGETRKHAMHAWESAREDAKPSSKD